MVHSRERDELQQFYVYAQKNAVKVTCKMVAILRVYGAIR